MLVPEEVQEAPLARWNGCLKAEDVLIDDGSPVAYRLAVLLIRKTLFSDDWDESWDEIVDDLREKASSDGVHPVWSKMAEATPILAQFAAFPQTEVEEQEADDFEMDVQESTH